MTRMVNIVTKNLCAAGLLVLCLTPAGASPRRQREGPRDMREDLQETVEIYMLARMKRMLQLDEEQARTIIPLMEDLNASRREFAHKRRKLVLRLRPLLSDDTDEEEVSDILGRLDAIESEHREKELKVNAEIRSHLTPVQQGRFLLFRERFRHEMEQRLRNLMQDQGRRRPGRPQRDRPRRMP